MKIITVTPHDTVLKTPTCFHLNNQCDSSLANAMLTQSQSNLASLICQECNVLSQTAQFPTLPMKEFDCAQSNFLIFGYNHVPE